MAVLILLQVDAALGASGRAFDSSAKRLGFDALPGQKKKKKSINSVVLKYSSLNALAQTVQFVHGLRLSDSG